LWLRQIIGTRIPHTLALEYSYRDRLFNGSLGFQTVQSSLGGVNLSRHSLGKTGINLSYQAGAQYINAETDRKTYWNPCAKMIVPHCRFRTCALVVDFTVAGERFTCHRWKD